MIQTLFRSLVKIRCDGHFHKFCILRGMTFLAILGILFGLLTQFGLQGEGARGEEEVPSSVATSAISEFKVQSGEELLGRRTGDPSPDTRNSSLLPLEKAPSSRSLLHRLFLNNWLGIGVAPVFVIGGLFVLVTLLTRLCMDAYCFWAIHVGLVDHPDDGRRLQAKPIPLGGGAVVFAVTLIVLIGLGALSDESVSISALLSSKILLPLLGSAALLVCVGLADDKWELQGRTKLLSQIVTASIVIAFARDFSVISLFGTELELGHAFYPLGVIWLVGLINAVNFLDGADGVAATAGIFMTLTAGVFAVITGQTTVFIITVVFAGALSGFLSCNFPPAKVYLGDAGSTLIGLVAGVLLIRSCTVENHVVPILLPFAVAIIPVFDALLSFYRRMSSGRGLFAPDRAHIHHRFLLRFQCNWKILRVFSVFFLSGGVVACLGMHHRNDWFPLAVVMTVPGVLIFSGLFGKEEMLTLWGRFRYEWKKRMHRNHDRDDDIGVMSRYQGDGPWDELWLDLKSSLTGVPCHKIHLDIDIPFLHESYVGHWESPEFFAPPAQKTEMKSHWECSLPFVYENKQVGRLDVTLDACMNSKFALFHQANELNLVFAGYLEELNQICMKYIEDFISEKKHSIPQPVFLKRRAGTDEQFSEVLLPENKDTSLSLSNAHSAPQKSETVLTD